MKLSTLFSRPILLLIAMGCSVAAKADSFDSTTGLLKLNLVTVGSAKYTVQLRLEDDGRLKLISAVPAVYTKSTFSTYDSTSWRLNTSVVDFDGQDYRGIFELDATGSYFSLLSARTKINTDGDELFDDEEGVDDADGDGLANYLDSDSDGDGIEDYIEEDRDSDRDGIIDSLDTDSDGDGIFDVSEGVLDNDNDGIANYIDLDSDGDGKFDDLDTDGDGISDREDFDDDNDGIQDSRDFDVDGDGIIDGSDADSDRIPDALEGIVDSDMDGILDYVDDDDADGIPDLLDDDSDGNGFLDTRDSDSDGITLVSTYRWRDDYLYGKSYSYKYSSNPGSISCKQAPT